MQQRFFYIRDNSISNRKSHSVANEIFEELQVINGKVPVIMRKKSYCITKIEKCHMNLAKITRAKRTMSKTTMGKFENELDQICNLIGQNYEKDNLGNRLLTESKQEQDLNFAVDQRNNIVGKILTKDTLYVKKIN